MIGKEDVSPEIRYADGSIVSTQFIRQAILCVHAPRSGFEIITVMKTKVNSKQTVLIRLRVSPWPHWQSYSIIHWGSNVISLPNRGFLYAHGVSFRLRCYEQLNGEFRKIANKMRTLTSVKERHIINLDFMVGNCCEIESKTSIETTTICNAWR